MIVCSKRVFLNVLTQLMDANTLINANYYIADQATRNGIAQMSDNITIDGEGTYRIDNTVATSSVSLNPYHINYGDGTLSPLALLSQLVLEQTGKDVETMFKEKLMCNDSLICTFNFLYANKPKGNGLRILLYVNDSIVPFIHIVCEYLSNLFGEDIMFIDKQYRNDIIGRVQYTGNQQKAQQVFREIMDYKMMKDIIDLGSNYQYGFGDTHNLEEYFESYSVPQMFYVYEKLFPNEPLPIGNYTKDHMLHILTRKLMHAFPQQTTMQNLMIPSFADMSSLYNNISDDEMMCIHE